MIRLERNRTEIGVFAGWVNHSPQVQRMNLNPNIAGKCVRTYVIFPASHDRLMRELIDPNRKDLKQVFAD
jgi:hypothetical protein